MTILHNYTSQHRVHSIFCGSEYTGYPTTPSGKGFVVIYSNQLFLLYTYLSFSSRSVKSYKIALWFMSMSNLFKWRDFFPLDFCLTVILILYFIPLTVFFLNSMTDNLKCFEKIGDLYVQYLYRSHVDLSKFDRQIKHMYRSIFYSWS